jgi:hypothetical protein
VDTTGSSEDSYEIRNWLNIERPQEKQYFWKRQDFVLGKSSDAIYCQLNLSKGIKIQNIKWQ